VSSSEAGGYIKQKIKNMKTEIQYFSNINDLSQRAAEKILAVSKKCVEEKGYFTFVLSGGETPKTLYKLLGQEPLSSQIPWEKTYLFWGDERCVAPDHVDSNYGLAHGILLNKVSIPEKNVYRIKGELSGKEAAVDYKKDIIFFLKDKKKKNFDLILLGLGSDGHTASLFPGYVFSEKDSDVEAVYAPEGKPPGERVTLTLSLINSAENVIFLVSDKKKEMVLSEVLKGNKSYPAALVKAQDSLKWFIEKVR